MIRWFNRRSLTAILLAAGAVMLQGCACDPNTPYSACPSHGYVAPGHDRNGEGGGNGGGGGMM
jgi:hypothetical protein